MGTEHSTNRILWRLAMALLVVTSGLGTGAYLYFQRVRENLRQESVDAISSIADLKIVQIAKWKQERLADAEFFFSNRAFFLFAKLVSERRRGSLEEFQDWFLPLLSSHDYRLIVLLDDSGEERFRVGDVEEAIGPEAWATLDQAKLTRSVRLSELYLNPAGVPSLDIAVPLLDSKEYGRGLVGFVLFRIDPSRQLFPLLRSWPRGSPTGETLLLRRDGDSILFLSWLRHRADAPLSVRVPLTQTELPAVFAARGGTGLFVGKDYRGIPVLATVRGVRGSSWYLVSKVDLEEVYGEVAKRARSFILAMSGLVVLAFLGVGLFFRQQHLQWSLQQARLQSEREALTKHFGQAAKHANDAILLADSNNRIVEVNDRAVELYGREREELLQLAMQDLRSPLVPELDAKSVVELERDGVIYESVHRGKDGADFPVEVSARRIEVNDRMFLQAIVRDVKDRKDDERRIARLNRLYSFQSQIGQAIIRSRDQQSLFEEACRIAVEKGLFRLAWFGLKEELTGAIRPVAKAGRDDGYVDQLAVTVQDEARGRGPAGTAMREERPVICNDILADERMLPWRQSCSDRDFRSLAVFPIVVGDVRAIYALYSGEVGFFDEEEAGALKKLTADLAFAVKFHQRESDRREAEKALMDSERKLRHLVETTHDLVWAMDRDGRISEMSADSVRIFGIQPEELIGRKFTELLHHDSLDEGWEAFQMGIRTGRPTVSFEAKTVGKEGHEVFLSINAVFIHDDKGTFIGEFGTAQDITDRKRVETALRESQERFREAEAVAHVGSWELDASTGSLFFSEEAQRFFGLPVSSDARPISELIPLVDDPKRMTRALIRVLRRGAKLETTFAVHPADGGDPRVLSVVAERKHSEEEETIRVVGILRDITMETRAVEALRRTEEKLRALFESDAVGVLFGDIHGRILDANQKLLDILGYSREELTENQIGWLQVTPPEFLPRDERGIREAREHGSCAPYQKQFIRKDGSRVWVLIGFTLIGDRREESVAFVIDLTRLKEAEEASREAELKYRLLVEQASDGIYSVDSSGCITFANSKFCDIVGYSAEEIGNLRLEDLLAHGEMPSQEAREKEAIGGESVRFECQMRRKDGSLFAAEGSMRGVAGGGFQTIVRDVTQRRADEERLRLLSSALHSAGNGVVITDRRGTVLWVNNAFTELTGYSWEEVVGGNPRILKSGQHDPEFYSDLWKTVLSGSIWHGELVNQRKDGSHYQEEMTITPIRGSDGEVTHFVAIKQDCTDRKQAQETLRRTNERLVETLKELKEAERQIIQQEQLRALGTMASGIAHDFNNSLLVILGFSELLLNQPETLTDSEKAGRYLTFINTAARDAGKVVDRLREFYRKRDKSDIFSPVDLNKLIEAAISLTQPRWASQSQVSGNSIEFVTELGEIPSIDGDQSELREALTNLIFNSVDAMPEGGTIRFRTKKRKGHVILEMSDTGVGMSEQVKSRCLEPFFTTKGDQGSGLGLSMVYGIVKRHEGEVQIETAVGGGTSITLIFPVPQEQETDSSSLPELGRQTPSRILLIDDERAVLQVLTHYLEVDGHSVESSASGDDGLEKFKSGSFDLVILDRAMPGMNGDQVAKEIRNMAPNTPIIMLTGFGSMMSDSGEKPGCVDLVLGKPVTQRQVRTAIAQVVRA